MKCKARRALIATGVCLLCCVAQAALPPAYGGSLTLPATGPIVLPHPAQRESPLEVSIAAAVFEPLSSLGEWQYETEADVSTATLLLSPSVVRHDQRALSANEVARSLRRLARTRARHWLAPIAEDGIQVVDGNLRLSLTDGRLQLQRWLSALPLSLVIAPGTGSGPYRPRITGGQLRLFQFRPAQRGAPFIRDVRFVPSGGRDEELRALVLGRLSGSWFGDSLLGQRPERAMRATSGGPESVVMLIPSPNRRPDLARVGAAIDRARLARVGLTPSARLSAALPPSRHAPGAVPGSRAIIYREGDHFAAGLCAALAARFDEAGLAIRPRAIPVGRWAQTVSSGRYDYRIAQVTPALTGDAILLSESYAEVGDYERARRLLLTGLGAGDEDLQAAARDLPALVLGRHQPRLFLDADLQDVRRDAQGRLLLEAMHFPRSRTRVAE